MLIKCKINESRVTLIREGMPAKISVDAIPGLQLVGRVKKVNRYAEPGSWMSSSVKEYATIVEIIDPPENIRTGMTAEAQIFVEQLPDALQVPIQALYEHGNDFYTLVQRGDDQFETVTVKVQATNDQMAAIESGLQEGDSVILNLRDHLDLMDLPELVTEDNSDLRDLSEDAGPDQSGDSQDRPMKGPAGKSTGDANGASGRGAAGGFGGPGGGAGGRPNISTIVDRSMERSDTDGDGQLSASEIEAMDSQFRGFIKAADGDGDGIVTKAELMKSFQSRMGGGGGRP